MDKHPLLIQGSDTQEFIKLRTIIDSCYDELIAAELTCQEAEAVIKYLRRKIKHCAINATIK